MINYNNKKFRALSNSDNGLVDLGLVFLYKQQGNILTCQYKGNHIKSGHLIGIVDELGIIDMRYHQVDMDDHLLTGVCRSIPKMTDEGKLRLYESWQWTSGDMSRGESVLEEI